MKNVRTPLAPEHLMERKSISVVIGMKLLTFFILHSSFFIFLSCTNDNEVSIDGRMLHMNMAEFFVYSTDGVIVGIDTIHVQGGRFEYDKGISKEGTLVVVFPNFTQMPLFVKPGMSIDISGDAAKLKELEVSGGDDNETYTEWRTENAEVPLAQQKKKAAQFITDNPDSPISLWMLRQYYVIAKTPDVKGVVALIDKMLKDVPDNMELRKMRTQLTTAGFIAVGDRVGHFSATDVNGRSVNESLLQSGTTVIMTVSSWNFDSQNMLRQLASKLRDENGIVNHVIAVSLDADVKECRRMVQNCNADNVSVICDGKQFESPLLMSLHLTTIPDNIVVKDGKVINRNVPVNEFVMLR